jgi:hypothetical protein
MKTVMVLLFTDRFHPYSYPLAEAHAGLGEPDCPPLRRGLLIGALSGPPGILLHDLPTLGLVLVTGAPP